ncbi:MAG: DinB family protein [Reichenbachiella sp.]|uniref:DinB family protein n=1 Tax=Reichenbachiella sp. TaxID=2184521 RepID=UPI003296FC4F
MKRISKPNTNEYHKFFAGYVGQIGDHDVLEMIIKQKDEFLKFFKVIPGDRHNYAYAEGKWTIKQVLRHMIDAERMFGYRAMSIARGEKAKLPGFDDHLYVEMADDSKNSMEDMLKEFETLREGHIQMISNFTIQATERMGNANGTDVSVRAIIYIIAGHVAHHKQIITERYLEHV